MKALAVWHDHGCGFLSRLLKQDYRHCFVVVLNGDYWIRLDGLNGVPVIEVVAGDDFDLAGFYTSENLTVIETETVEAVPRQPFMLGTCVGVAKRVLGVRAPWIATPYQLYRHLRKRK